MCMALALAMQTAVTEQIHLQHRVLVMTYLLFLSIGVYTKNRNFRLFMSSKLGKKNPLTVSDQNQHHLDKAADYDEQLFYDSLVANVQ